MWHWVMLIEKLRTQGKMAVDILTAVMWDYPWQNFSDLSSQRWEGILEDVTVSLMAPCYDAIAFNELSLRFIHHLRQDVQQPVATFASVTDLLGLGKLSGISSFSTFLPSNFLQVLPLSPRKINKVNIPTIESRCSSKRWDTSVFVTPQFTTV